MVKDRAWLHLNSNRWNSAITEYACTLVKSLSDHSSESFQMVYGLPDKPYLRRIQKEVRSQGKLFLRGTRFGFVAWFSLMFVSKPKAVLVSQGREALFIQSLKLLGFFQKTPFIRFYGSAQQRPASRIARLVYSTLPFLRPIALFPTQTMQKKTGLDGVVVPLAVDANRFYLDKRSYQKSQQTMLIFGRFDPVKGHREFLEVFKKFSIEEGQKTTLRIVGKSANISKNDLESWVVENDLEELVEVVDKQVDNVAELFSSTTLGVVPSNGSEVICRVTQEMLCCGTPVIVSGVGSLHEYVDQENVFLLQDEHSLFKAMEVARRESVDKRQSRSTRFQSEYSMAAMAEALLAQLT